MRKHRYAMPTAPRQGHYTSVMPFLYGARYVVCKEPGCGHVIRNTLVWPAMKPLIHNGRRYRG